MKIEPIKAYGLVPYKIEDGDIKILLCKSIKSNYRWGFLKGMILKGETPKQCARREFLEESGIDIDYSLFEDYFEQKNKEKDIGIWLVNSEKVKDIEKYFLGYKLVDRYLSWENSKVKYFSIHDLPVFKTKQKKLVKKVKGFLQSKNQSH